MKLSLSITSIVVILISVLFVFSSCNSKNELTIEEIDSIIYDDLTRPIDVEELMSKLGISGNEKVSEEQTTTEISTESLQQTTTESAETTTTTTTVIPNSKTVYITPSGKRYHLNPTCGGKNSYAVSIDNVDGRTPCQKCAQ